MRQKKEYLSLKTNSWKDLSPTSIKIKKLEKLKTVLEIYGTLSSAQAHISYEFLKMSKDHAAAPMGPLYPIPNLREHHQRCLVYPQRTCSGAGLSCC